MKRRNDSGFTLVELLIAIVLTGVIAGAVVTALGTSLHAASTTSQKVRESNDAQLISTFLVRDAQAAGGTDPATAQEDPTLGVSTSDAAGCAAPGSLVIRFSWRDRLTSSTSRVMVATYGLDGSAHQLVRRLCVAGTPQDVTLGRHVLSAIPDLSGLPSTVALTITETNDPQNAPVGFTYILRASLRHQAEDTPTPANATAVPLLALGGGSCSGNTPPALSLSGGADVTVYGDVIVNTTCSAMSANGSLTYTVVGGTTQILGTGSCSGNRCPATTSYSTPWNDPFTSLTPPSGPCTYTQKLSITQDTTFAPGVYILCNGLEAQSHATISGTGVFFYLRGGTLSISGQATIDLSAPTTGPYANLLFWVATIQNVNIDGGSDVNTFAGLIYAPLSNVTLNGGTESQIGGIIARSITFSGGGISVLGPAPTIGISPGTLPSGKVGVAYSASLTATGGATPYAWSANGLPNGLTMNSSTGVISGSPSAPFSATVTVTATDVNGASGSRPYTLTISTPPTVSGPANLPIGTQGHAYPATNVTATGGTTPYSWSATGLPAGLTIDNVSGTISGTPTATGNFPVTVTVTDATSASANRPYNLTVNPAPAITGPAILPNWTVGKAYPSTTATAAGGTTPYTWSAAWLPNGLTINSSTGAITGTPTTPNTFNAVVTVTDATGATDTVTYSNVIISAAPSITSPSSLPSSTVNKPYPTSTMTVTGGTGPYTWTASGLPAGLTMSSGGVISGTPTVANTYNISVQVKDAAQATSTRNYAFTIYSVPTISSPGSLSPWTINKAYPSTTLTGNSGVTPYTWSATGLPSGLTVNAGTGVISGTPNVAGSFPVTVTLTDAVGNSGTRNYTLDINSPPIILAPGTLASGKKGTAYPSTPLTVTAGTAPYSWSASGLPPGLAIGSTTGVISGTPTAGGTFPVTVTVTDGAGATGTRVYSVSVLAISGPATLPDWTVNRGGYSATATAIGGATPYTWTAPGLPPGLTINSATGGIAGTPTATGPFTVTLTVTDAQAKTVTQAYVVTINAPPTLKASITVSKNKHFNPVSLVNTAGTPSDSCSSSTTPSWATLNSDCTISGDAPKTAGSYPFTVTIVDAVGATSTSTVTIIFN